MGQVRRCRCGERRGKKVFSPMALTQFSPNFHDCKEKSEPHAHPQFPSRGHLHFIYAKQVPKMFHQRHCEVLCWFTESL